MLARVAADAVLVLHVAFIAFVLLGALLASRWRWMPVVHLPAALWGAFVEVTGRLCPLTDLENYFRAQAGQGGYSASFIERYLLPMIYPSELHRHAQIALGAVVLVVNAVAYGLVLRRHGHRRD